MFVYRLDQLLRLQIPESDLPIAASTGQITIMHTDTQHGAGMGVIKNVFDKPCGKTPLPYAFVPRAGEEQLSASVGLRVEL